MLHKDDAILMCAVVTACSR